MNLPRKLLPAAVLAAVATAAILSALSASARETLPVEDLIERGDRLDAQMKSKEALEYYLRALPAAPERSGLLRRISKQYAEMIIDAPAPEKKLELAKTAVQYAGKALAAPDADADARVGLAICLAKLADLSDNKTKVTISARIKALCAEAIRMDPGHELAHHVLGRWHLEVAVMNPLVRGIARIVYGQIPPGSLAEAERLLRRAVELNPRRVANLIELGRTLWYQGKRDEARQLITQAITLPETNRDDPELKRRARALID